MELSGLEADEPAVKTQMTVTTKRRKCRKISQKQNEKSKTETLNTVPNKTLKNDQCSYCKETGHMMTDCPKIAKRRKLEENQDAESAKMSNHVVMKRKTAISALTWKNAQQRGTSQKP